MPRPRSTMRKIRELLRLHRGEGLSRRQAAIAAGMPYATAADHLARAGRAGLGWLLPDGLDDAQLEARLFVPVSARPPVELRHCRARGVELEARRGPGRPLAWCEAHRTAIGRRPTGRVCDGCGVSLAGRRRQTVVCGERCRSRLRRARPATGSPLTNPETTSARDRVPAP